MVFLMQTQTGSAGSIPAELRAETARQKLSGRELARKMNRHQLWVSRRLSGDVPISADELREFAFVLGKPVAQFYGEVAA